VEAAALAAADGRPVYTVLVDASDFNDPRTAFAFTSADLRSAHLVLTLPGAGWGAAVDRGLRHALQLGACTVVVADADVPADLDAPAETSRVAAGVTRLGEQDRAGVVCVPLAAPWWQRLLAIHVLRPLCAPALGLSISDPHARTLVLSARAAAEALRPRWQLAEMHGHGLGIVAAARSAGLDLGQTLLRLPTAEGLARILQRAPVDHHDAAALLPIALGLARVDPPQRRVPVWPWLTDLGFAPGHLPPPEVVDDMLARCAAGSRRGGSGGWPDPLVTAWHAARDSSPDLAALAERLWLDYLARLAPWLRVVASTGSYTGPAHASAADAARQFLGATGTPVQPLPKPGAAKHGGP
jgi:hypothetical protein